MSSDLEQRVATAVFLAEIAPKVNGQRLEVDQFHWADYLIFSASLLVSLVIGVYFACAGDKQRTTEEFLLAGRSAGQIRTSFASNRFF